MSDMRSTREIGNGKQRFAMPKKNAKAFEFLKLPAEVRNMIYRNLLVKKRYCYFFFQPPLTLTNKQIRSESLAVLYGNNKFIIYFDRDLLVQDPSKRLRNLWEVPPSLSTVSSIPNFVYVAKLDIRCTFTNDWFPKSGDVDVFIRMRMKGLSNRSSMANGMVSQHGLKWNDRAILEAAYDLLVNDCLRGPQFSGERQLAYGGMDSVIATVLYFAEICPAAAEWVRMELERKTPCRRA